MDDRTQTCPNCGEAVPATARFCVTCGIRLPEPAAHAGSSESAARGGWSQPGEDVWIGEAPARNDDSPQPRDQEPQAASLDDQSSNETSHTGEHAVEADEVMALPPAEPVEPAGQPADAAVSPETTDEQPVDASFEQSAGEPETGDAMPPAEHGAWPVHDDRGADGHTDLESDDGAWAAGEQVGPEGELADMASDDAGAFAEETATASGPVEQERSDPDRADAVDPEADTLNGDDFEPAGWNDDDEMATPVAGEPANESGKEHDMMALATAARAESAEPATVGDQPPAVERAGALLDELKELLPQLAAPVAPSAPVVDLTALRERAIAARGETSLDNFSALRAAIADAVSRPRDIEVVLRLSQRIDDIDALLNEYDRLRTGFDEVVEGIGQ